MRGGTAKSRPHKRWRASGDDDARAIRVSAPPYAHACTYDLGLRAASQQHYKLELKSKYLCLSIKMKLYE